MPHGGAMEQRLLGNVPVWVRPSGSNSRSRITASQTLPVTTSITRPRIEKPVLQYSH